MLKVSSPARRPQAFNWSSPPWSTRAAAQSLSPHRLPGRKEGGGALVCPGSGHLRAARPPRFGRPAVDSSQAADQMGITRGREADHSVLRGPSWLRKEVTSAL